MKNWITTLCASLTLVAGSALANPVVYQQTWDGGNNYFASQNDSNPGGFGAFAKVYDNFSLASNTSITDVHWTGGYFNGQQAPISNFLIEIWSNAGGPSAVLFSETVAGTANETAVGGSFSYDVDLSSAFQAQAGTTYWLSIQPTVGFPPQWGWATGTGGDGISMQDFLGSRSRVDSDMAFSLTGVDATTVPEPDTMLLVALAVLGAAAASRRKTQR